MIKSSNKEYIQAGPGTQEHLSKGVFLFYGILRQDVTHLQSATCLGVLGSGIPGMDHHIRLLSILPSCLFSLFGVARKTLDQTMPDGLMELCAQSSFLLPVPSRWWKAPEVHIYVRRWTSEPIETVRPKKQVMCNYSQSLGAASSPHPRHQHLDEVSLIRE